MDRGNNNGRGGGRNRGRNSGRVHGYNEQRQGHARGYYAPRQYRARADYEEEQGRARGQHEQEQGRARVQHEQEQGRGRGRGRGGRDGFHMGSSSSTGQHQFTETGAPENQLVSQTPAATTISYADMVRIGVGTASPSPQHQQKDVPVLLGKINSKKREPMGRPADGGNNSYESISLQANHFPVKFKDGTIILHYDVDVQQVDENQPVTDKFDLRKIREKWLMDKPAEFPCDKTAYDGIRNIYSAVHLPAKPLTVNCSVGDDAKECNYTLTFKFVAELQLDNVTEYVKRNGLQDIIPRGVLQGMDLVMKENPKRCRISVGRCFYSRNDLKNLGCGVNAHTGFQQSLKPTSKGLALCLDSSELALPKPISVIDFLMEYFGQEEKIEDIFNGKTAQVRDLLTGLKVKVNHRPSKQKFVIKGLTVANTRDVKFRLQGSEEKKVVSLVDYFNKHYNRVIEFQDIPSLDIGKGNKENYVPLEFCDMVVEQRFPKDRLSNKAEALTWRKKLPSPVDRRKTICQTVKAEDGPCRTIPGNFDITVDDQMTHILGRILPIPVLKQGDQAPVKVNSRKCQWNFVENSVLVEGKELQRWALINFSSKNDRGLEKKVDTFVGRLKKQYLSLGINMEEPAVKHYTHMNKLSTVGTVEKLLNYVVNEAGKGELQMIVCVMESKDKGYKYLKWVSETKIGTVTQCCLSSNAYYNAKDQFFANLCLKINAKLGGSNIELMERLPNFSDGDNVMFIGADVNHPTGKDADKCPSIAAVVATINWPAANKYAARVRPQESRSEKILKFGKMCKSLVETYALLNSVKPNKIVVFRDGVSESQFDMVLNEELNDLVEAIYERNKYKPAITLVVAQKRHHTRLFPTEGNVPPGTVVDTKIVHPYDFDFYLCSHYGQLGTSKATHYHVLYDENDFSSVDLQKLIYNMCFTFARCTKSVSLVPPVYYADLVAYRGRMFHDMHTETKAADATTSSDAASSSSSSSPDSLAENFYGLHSDLRNNMFFV